MTQPKETFPVELVFYQITLSRRVTDRDLRLASEHGVSSMQHSLAQATVEILSNIRANRFKAEPYMETTAEGCEVKEAECKNPNSTSPRTTYCFNNDV